MGKAKTDFIALCAEQESKTEKVIKMRDATSEEQKSVYDYIKSISKSTGVNFGVLEQKPKTGHWIKTPKAVMGEGYMWYCNKCEYEVYQDRSRSYPSEKYCPYCGARMVEEQESEV